MTNDQSRQGGMTNGGTILRGMASVLQEVKPGDSVLVRFRAEGLHWVHEEP
jgi:hypothetical protein